jgi:hypothetical protein
MLPRHDAGRRRAPASLEIRLDAMIDESKVKAWVDGYERIWRTAGTEQIAELFTNDATYQMHPFLEPHRGLEAIRVLWDAERASHDEEFEMRSSVVAVDGPRAVVRVEVRYGPPRPRHFRDLWILDFAPDGKCQAFEEWPMSAERIAVDIAG